MRLTSLLALALGGCAVSVPACPLGHRELRPYDRPPVTLAENGALESDMTAWLESDEECATCGYVRAGPAWTRTSTSLRGFRHLPSPLILALVRRGDARGFIYEQRETSGGLQETLEIFVEKDIEDLLPSPPLYDCRGGASYTGDGVSIHLRDARLRARVTR